jgi:hypothetical protein
MSPSKIPGAATTTTTSCPCEDECGSKKKNVKRRREEGEEDDDDCSKKKKVMSRREEENDDDEEDDSDKEEPDEGTLLKMLHDDDKEENPKTVERMIRHCVLWDDNKNLQNIKGIDFCGSITTWYAIATAELDLTNDPRTAYDFHLVNIPECWMHDDPIPITKMYMRYLMDLLEGLEWHVFSDFTHKARSAEWKKQVLDMLQLIVHRCIQFVQNKWDTVVLDVEEYRVAKSISFFSKEDEGITSKKLKLYETRDEQAEITQYENERRKKIKIHLDGQNVTGEYSTPFLSSSSSSKKKKVVEKLEMGEEEKDIPNPSIPVKEKKKETEWTRNVVCVSLAWFYDVDAMITNFWMSYIQDVMYPLPPPIPIKPDLTWFRYRLFEEIRKMKEIEVVKYRRMWYENNLVTESHLRVYKRRASHDTRPAARAVILSKNDNIYPEPCSTTEDIVNPMVSDSVIANNLHMQTSTDSLFFKYSDSQAIHMSDVCSVVFRKTREEGILRGTFPYIFRNRLHNVWEVVLSEKGNVLESVEDRFTASSFTDCFYYARVWMRERGIPPIVKQMNLSRMDKMMFQREGKETF